MHAQTDADFLQIFNEFLCATPSAGRDKPLALLKIHKRCGHRALAVYGRTSSDKK